MAKDDAEIKELTKKLAQNPDSMVFVQLADALRRAGDLEQGIAVCLKGLTKHPGYVTGRVVLGRSYMDAGRLDEAIEEFTRIEAAEPDNVMVHRMLGEIYLKKGRFGDVVARQQKLLSIDPDDSTAQELLQEALALAKTQEGSKGPNPVKPAAPKAAGGPDQHGNLKVADIYIKKGAWDEAAEVLQEILASDPANAVARQRLGEVQANMGTSPRYAEAVAKAEDHKRKAEEETRAKAEAEAKRKAEEDAKKKAEADAEAKRKADEEAKKKAEAESKAKAEAEAKKKAEEEAKRKAEEEAKKKAEAEAKAKAEAEAKKKAEEEAKRKAEEEAKKKAEAEAKAKAEAEAKKKAEEEAKRKAEEEAKKKAEAEAKAKAEAEAKKKAEEEAKRKAEEEAKKKAEEEARKKAEALTAKAILSVMTPGSDDLIDDEQAKAAPAAPGASGLSGEVKALIEAFVKAQGIESFLLLDPKGGILQKQLSGDANALAGVADAIFRSTEKAAARMGLGGLKQINIVGEDGRQILSVSLKAGVFVGLTGKNTNLGLLRVAVNDLAKKA